MILAEESCLEHHRVSREHQVGFFHAKRKMFLCVKSSSRPKLCDLLELRVIWTNLRVGLTPQNPTEPDPAYRAGWFYLESCKNKLEHPVWTLEMMVWRSAACHIILPPRQAC
jgi:hypothetical protein